jgi:hypothetical protein
LCFDLSPASAAAAALAVASLAMARTLPRCIDDGIASSSQRRRLLAFGSRMKTVEEFPEEKRFDVFLSLSGGGI